MGWAGGMEQTHSRTDPTRSLAQHAQHFLQATTNFTIANLPSSTGCHFPGLRFTAQTVKFLATDYITLKGPVLKSIIECGCTWLMVNYVFEQSKAVPKQGFRNGTDTMVPGGQIQAVRWKQARRTGPVG